MYRGEVLRPHAAVDSEDSDGAADSDIGGDMNHIHRVAIRLFHGGQSSVTTVIVKTAPDEVLVCLSSLCVCVCVCVCVVV